MSYLPYLLWLALRGAPSQALEEKTDGTDDNGPSKEAQGEDLGPFCNKNKRRTTSGEALSHWTGPSLSDILCSTFTNSTFHSWGPAQPGLTVDPMGPHLTPGSSLLVDGVNRWHLECG